MTMLAPQPFDVVIAGAGIAGCAAALEAARSGARIALLEKSVLPGGLATAGLVHIYLPLCDGHGTQVSCGIAEELLQASIKYGPGTIPACWRAGHAAPEHGRLRVVFSPAAFVLALDELLEQAGVTLWYDTVVCATRVEAGRVTALEVENKSGRGRLRAACFVDATGDADLARQAGAAYVEQENWLSLWALEATLVCARDAVQCGAGAPLLKLITAGGDNVGNGHPPGTPKWRGTNGRDVSNYVIESRRLLRAHYQQRQRDLGEHGRNDAFPLTLPSMAQLRTTCAVVGRTTMHAGEAWQARTDAIGLVADWRKPGFVWEMPFGALLPRDVRGLLMAGRCIASVDDAWEVTRVIPAAAVSGQAAGAAAALAARQGITPDALDVAQLQQHLRARGVPLQYADVGLSAPTG